MFMKQEMNRDQVMLVKLFILHRQFDHVEFFTSNQLNNLLLFDEKLYDVILYHRKMLSFIVNRLLVHQRIIMLMMKIKWFLKIDLHQ